MKKILDYFLRSKIESDNLWLATKQTTEFRKGRKLFLLGLMLMLAPTCIAQVVTDVGSNPFIKGLIGATDLLVYGAGGAMMIFGIFLLAKSWMGSDQMNRGKGWKAVAGGAVVMGAYPIAKWVNTWWKANETGVGDIYLGG